MKIPHLESINENLTEADVLLTRQEAAQYLRRSTPTLERWARDGSGPKFKIVGGRALYPLLGLRKFVGVVAEDA